MPSGNLVSLENYFMLIIIEINRLCRVCGTGGAVRSQVRIRLAFESLSKRGSMASNGPSEVDDDDGKKEPVLKMIGSNAIQNPSLCRKSTVFGC